MTTTERPTTLCQVFQHVAAIDPDAVALRTVGGTETLTWREYAQQVHRIAAGFAALGMAHGDTLALMMRNRTEFYPIDVAALHLGAASFSVYNTLTAPAIAHVLSNARAKIVVCEAQYVDHIRASGAPLDHIVTLDTPPGHQPPGTRTLEELTTLAPPAEFDFEHAWRAVEPDDVATLIYTSGTTGPPKGVETTHANLLFETGAVARVLPVEYGDRITSFLPSAHIADRLTALYLQLVFGTQVTVVGDPSEITAAIHDCVPTLWGAVPRVWEKLKAGIEARIAHEANPAHKQALDWALDVGKRRVELLRSNRTVPAQLADDHAAAEASVLAPLRTELGFGELKWALSGAAPIAPDTLAFFAALGLPISEIWGMSELTCIASVAQATPDKLGTVGRILPGMQARLADDGELLVTGPLVMRGYRGEPTKTAEAFTSDGWLRTGDVATVNDEGDITIVDRKKDLIINATGKNIAPTNIENTIAAASPLIGSVVAIGDARPYVAALITINTEVASDLRPADLVEQVADAVARANANLARVEQIKRFRILPDSWTPGSEELTPTMKLRRKAIAEKYTTQIEQLYTDPIADHVHEPAPQQHSSAPVHTGKATG